MKNDNFFPGLLSYLLFGAAVIGVIIGIILIMKKKMDPKMDLIVVVICAASAFILYISKFKDARNFQTGAYLLLIGLILALVFQIISLVKKEK